MCVLSSEEKPLDQTRTLVAAGSKKRIYPHVAEAIEALAPIVHRSQTPSLWFRLSLKAGTIQIGTLNYLTTTGLVEVTGLFRTTLKVYCRTGERTVPKVRWRN